MITSFMRIVIRQLRKSVALIHYQNVMFDFLGQNM